MRERVVLLRCGHRPSRSSRRPTCPFVFVKTLDLAKTVTHGIQISLSSERTSWLSYHGLWPQDIQERLARIASLCSHSFANSRRRGFEYRVHRNTKRRFKLRVAHLNSQTLRQRAAETGAHARTSLKPPRGLRAVVPAGQRHDSQHPRVPVRVKQNTTSFSNCPYEVN